MLDTTEIIRKIVLNCARYTAIAPLASHLLGGIGAILMLHRVNSRHANESPMNAGLTVTPDFLDAVISDMKRCGFVFVSLDDAVERLAAERAGMARFAAITFDDGYLDNLTDALPVLQKHGVPATIYIAPALVTGAVLPWWEIAEEAVMAGRTINLPASAGSLTLNCATPQARKESARHLFRLLGSEIEEEDQQLLLHHLMAATPIEADRRRFMNWDELRTLARNPLITLGAHTVHHYNLKRLPRRQALAEMTDSAMIIERETDDRPHHFAFPYGHPQAVAEREVALAREAGFTTAVTTRHGVLLPRHRDHLHALPRISLNGRYQHTGYVRTMLSGLTTPLANKGRRLATV